MDQDKPGLPRIAGYTTEAVLGEGGMATVYLAVQESLARHVALKVMNHILMADADFRRRFLNEGRMIAKLSHPNIVTVYDIGASDHYHYLSMTYLPGGTLREKIRQGLTLDNALYILQCLADALGYAHRQGIVHRDIKPGNVLFTHSGAPVLTDFGIAKTVGNETRLTSTGMAIGSVGYMSPEQALGNEVDHRSDLYSLGVLFWQMVTGTLPYAAPDPFALAFKHAHDPIPELPKPIRRFQPVVAALMAKQPQDRLGSAEELLRMLDSINYKDIGAHSPSGAGETVVLPRHPDSAPNRRSGSARAAGVPASPPRRRLGLAAAVVGLVVVAGAAGWVYYSGLLGTSPAAPAAPPSYSQAPAPKTPASPETLGGALQRPTPAPGPALTATPPGRPDQEGHAAPSGDRPPGAGGPAETPTGGAEQRIQALMLQAQRQMRAGRLTEPPGDNAFESYSRILEIDPEQPQAKQELVNIGRINAANKVFATADALLRQGAVEDARRMIDTGLKMNPDDERLLGLQQALNYGQ